MRTKVADAKSALGKGQPARAWRQLGLRQGLRQTARHASCTAFSYGAAQLFFAATPCRSLRRLTLPLSDVNGHSIVLAVSWVRMRTERDAARLRLLVDEHGTGNVAPLGMRGLQQRGVRFTGEHYDSDRDGRTVVIAEAEALAGRPSDGLLDAVATVGAALPWPR